MNLSSVRATFVSVSAAMLLCCMLGGGFRPGVVAAAELGASAAAPTRFAHVLRIRGEVTATVGEAGPSRMLSEGAPVFTGERIRAAAAAEAVLKTDDAGLIAIRPGAQLVMERYAAEGKSTDVFDLRVIEGGLRMITGWFSTNRSRYRVSTPTVTMGIRGTDHEPYVISVNLAATLSQIAGTYDKVNRGGTTMDVNGKKLDIDAGKVGFARGTRSRGLLTILLPVLLDKVPDFYVPGQFDAELDRLSQTADEDALRALEARREALPDPSPAETPGPGATTSAAPPAEPAAAPAPAAAAAAARKPAVPAAGECAADTVARTWLREFDTAVERRDAPAVIRKFAPEVLVRATVRGAGGEPATVEMGRDEMVQSTIAAVRGLTQYQQRRPSVESRPAGAGAGMCERISVRSVVIEQGRQNGKPYRFESIEEFLLERRAGVWLAIRAETTQR